MTRMLLSLFGREKTPRLEAAVDYAWVKAFAARWWLVEAASLDAALEHIRRARFLSPREQAPMPGLGRVVDCGRNARGGPGRSGAPSRNLARSKSARIHARNQTV